MELCRQSTFVLPTTVINTQTKAGHPPASCFDLKSLRCLTSLNSTYAITKIIDITLLLVQSSNIHQVSNDAIRAYDKESILLG